MRELAASGLFLGVGFAVSAVVSWWFTRSRLNRMRPAAGAKVRLRVGCGSYHSRFISGGPRWRIAAPLRQDRQVPMRVGDSVQLEVSAADGAWVGEAEIIEQDSITHELILAPGPGRRIDRRRVRRRPGFDLEVARLDGMEFAVLDVSEGGARLGGRARLPRGVRSTLEWGGVEIGAWVLASDGVETRLRFEDPARV